MRKIHFCLTFLLLAACTAAKTPPLAVPATPEPPADVAAPPAAAEEESTDEPVDPDSLQDVEALRQALLALPPEAQPRIDASVWECLEQPSCVGDDHLRVFIFFHVDISEDERRLMMERGIAFGVDLVGGEARFALGRVSFGDFYRLAADSRVQQVAVGNRPVFLRHEEPTGRSVPTAS